MDARIQRLINWSISNGSHISPKLIFQNDRYRGIYAISNETSSSPAETPQLEIPLKMIIRKELSDSFFGNYSLNSKSFLKLFLAKLKFDKSQGTLVDGVDLAEFFRPYIDLLPVGRETGSPIYWSEDELNLLENTNLGGSLPAKLASFLEEWYTTMKDLPLKFHTVQYKADLEIYNKFNVLSRTEVLLELLNVTSWTSFGAYVWSTLMFTSRAFPQKIIDKDVEDGQAILLPLIDLLNHNNGTRVDWNYDDRAGTGFFSLHNKDIMNEGDEIFNNYGAKGNEELLMGYGFVIDGNNFDSVALRVKLDMDTIKRAEEFGVKLPKIDDYTFHAFSNKQQSKEGPSEEELRDGLLFFLNRFNPVPDNLASLFLFLVKNGKETRPTLRAKFEALQRLRVALEKKLGAIKQKVSVDKSSIDSHIVSTAESYRKGQKDIYKASLSHIRNIEKNMLHHYKTHVTTLKKLYKRNEALQELAKVAFNLDNYESIENEDFVDVAFYIWLVLSAHSEDYIAPEWIKHEFRTYSKGSSTENQSFKGLELLLKSQIKDESVSKLLTTRNLSIASEIIRLNSYIRVSCNEVILVEPVNI